MQKVLHSLSLCTKVVLWLINLPWWRPYCLHVETTLAIVSCKRLPNNSELQQTTSEVIFDKGQQFYTAIGGLYVFFLYDNIKQCQLAKIKCSLIEHAHFFWHIHKWKLKQTLFPKREKALWFSMTEIHFKDHSKYYALYILE